MAKVLFYLISSRGTKRFEVLNIAKRTLKNRTAMDDFLKAWAEKSHCWDSSNNCITYGYEAPTKTRRFALSTAPRWRDDAKGSIVSRLLSKTAATKLLKKKKDLEQWFLDKGTNILPQRYELKEFKVEV